MVTLKDVFEDLATGELAGIKMGETGTILAADYSRVVNAINLGLFDLYSKFLLKKGEYTLHQQTGVTTYYLRSDYSAELDSIDSTHYIENPTGIAFQDDLIRITDIFDTATDDLIPLNDKQFLTTGAFTLTPDTLKMTPAVPPLILSIEYQARYPKILITEPFVPANVTLNIPTYIVPALLLFVAAKIYRGMSSRAAEGEVTSAYTFKTLYDIKCAEIAQLGLVDADNNSSEQFDNNGWE